MPLGRLAMVEIEHTAWPIPHSRLWERRPPIMLSCTLIPNAPPSDSLLAIILIYHDLSSTNYARIQLSKKKLTEKTLAIDWGVSWSSAISTTPGWPSRDTRTVSTEEAENLELWDAITREHATTMSNQQSLGVNDRLARALAGTISKPWPLSVVCTK